MLNEPDMFKKLVHERRSVRKFKQAAVPEEILKQVFEAAQRSPSNCNTQPWVPYVLSGEACDRLREKVFTAWNNQELSMDFPYEGRYQGVYKERQYDAAQALYSVMGIERADKAARNTQFIKNFEFFGAPHVTFLFLHEDFGLREAADLGMYAQTLMLSMSAHGLASCPQTALSFFADLIRTELSIPAELKLVFGISFGYEDPESQVNKCVTDRDSVEEFVNFVS